MSTQNTKTAYTNRNITTNINHDVISNTNHHIYIRPHAVCFAWALVPVQCLWRLIDMCFRSRCLAPHATTAIDTAKAADMFNTRTGKVKPTSSTHIIISV
jgi:hypothetical protein